MGVRHKFGRTRGLNMDLRREGVEAGVCTGFEKWEPHARKQLGPKVREVLTRVAADDAK